MSMTFPTSDTVCAILRPYGLDASLCRRQTLTLVELLEAGFIDSCEWKSCMAVMSLQ